MTDDRHPIVLLDRFELEPEPMGEGGTGVVYGATDRATGAAVVVKLLHPHLTADAGARSALAAAAGAASRLEHPHALRVLGLWSDGGRWLLVSDRVAGPSLEGLVEDAGPLPARAVAALGADLASALAAGHAASMIHGDVRPGNVLVGPGGAVLFDWGVASRQPGQSGRPGETAPEVLRGTRAGAAADLYGLGVVLHSALTGRLAFAGPTPWAVVGAQQAGPPELEGPSGLVALVRALLDPNPARRPSSAADVERVLRLLTAAPERVARVRRRWLAPIRPQGAWVVRGVDPRTGGDVVLGAGLSRRRAWVFAARLKAAGWSATPVREALDALDLAMAGGAAAIGLCVPPLVGVPLLGGGALWLLSRRCQPEVRLVLPQVTPPTAPPAADQGGGMVVGALLALTAALLVLFPPAAAVSALAVVAVILGGWRRADRQIAARAEAGRFASAIADARRALERSALSMDEQLCLAGELDEVEQGWRAELRDVDALVLRAEALSERARAAEWPDDGGAATALAALRAPGGALDAVPPIAHHGSHRSPPEGTRDPGSS